MSIREGMDLQRGEKNADSSSQHSWLRVCWGISLFLGLMDWENLGLGTIPHQAGFMPGLFIRELRPTSPVLLPGPGEGGLPDLTVQGRVFLDV